MKSNARDEIFQNCLERAREAAAPPTGSDHFALLEHLEDGIGPSVIDDELVEVVRWLHRGFQGKAPRVPDARLSFPPRHAVDKPGRLNRAYEPIFYGAFRSASVGLHEKHAEPGHEYVISEWELKAETVFNQFGYSTDDTNAHGYRREPPPGIVPDGESDRNRVIRDWQARVFRREVENEHELYRVTIALKDLALSMLPRSLPNGDQSFKGIMYPSVGSYLMGDNVAIHPDHVYQLLSFRNAELVRVNFRGPIETEAGPKPGFEYDRLSISSIAGDDSLEWRAIQQL
jgi:hypothetical protein